LCLEAVDALEEWVESIRQVSANCAIVLAITKMDLKGSYFNKTALAGQVQKDRRIESMVFCSAVKNRMIDQLIFAAEKAGTYPSHPLWTEDYTSLSPLLLRCLRSIFRAHVKSDPTGMTEVEFYQFHKLSFACAVKTEEIWELKKFLLSKVILYKTCISIPRESYLYC